MKQQYTKTNSLILCILMLCIYPPLWAQFSQMGNDIDGEAAGDIFGYSVSLSADGMVMAVGAINNDDNGNNAGHVRVYEWTGSAWIQRGSDIDGEAAGDILGHSISLSANGNILAIGAPLNDGNGINAGHARVYEWTGSVWGQKGTDINGAADNLFGTSVSLSANGNILAIGAPYHNSYTGQVRVYEWLNNAWVQKGVDIDGEAAWEHSGFSVSLSQNGDILAIGTIRNTSNFYEQGQVRVYEWINNAWTQKGLDIEGEAAGDQSGFSISLNGDGTVLAIGAPNNNSDSGHVRVYEWISSSWVQRGSDIDGVLDYLGWSVDLSANGNILVIGAVGSNAGHTRIYEWIANTWVQKGLNINGEAIGDWSGWSVSLNVDGTILAIGAPENDGNGSEAGHVRVYNISTFNSITTIENNNINIYPNPTNDLLHIDQEENHAITISIFDDLGRLLLQQQTSDRRSNLSLSHLPTGVYLVVVNNEKELITQKIIKQ